MRVLFLKLSSDALRRLRSTENPYHISVKEQSIQTPNGRAEMTVQRRQMACPRLPNQSLNLFSVSPNLAGVTSGPELRDLFQPLLTLWEMCCLAELAQPSFRLGSEMPEKTDHFCVVCKRGGVMDGLCLCCRKVGLRDETFLPLIYAYTEYGVYILRQCSVYVF